MEPALWTAMAAAVGAAIAVLARRTAWLRPALGTSVRTWVTGCAVIVTVVAATFGLEAIFLAGDHWQYLGTAVAAFFSLYAGVIAGAVVAITTPARARWEPVEVVVHGALAGALLSGLAMWTWVLAISLPSEL